MDQEKYGLDTETVKIALEQALKAQRWRRYIALLFLQPRR
jgi:hypothetical protein